MVLSRRTRWTLFALAVIAFSITAYIVLQYARGYTFTLAERGFVLTGAVRLELNESADVTLDGKTVESSSFLGNLYAADRLAPGTYAIRAERDGYSSWAKTVTIEEGFLTDFPNVRLFPLDEETASRSRGLIDERYARITEELAESPAPTPVPSPSVTPEPQRGFALLEGELTLDEDTVASPVLGYELSDDSSRILWWTRNEVWVMWLRNAQEQPLKRAMEREILTRLSSTITFATWWPDEHYVAVVSNDEYRIVEIDTRGGTNIVKLP